MYRVILYYYKKTKQIVIMVRLAIRDDDANFFTKVQDLEQIYGAFEKFPVSFAVIPNVIDVSTKGSCPDTRGNTVPRFIGENVELCSWFKYKLHLGECDVIMHGINHLYHCGDGRRQPEMIWRDKQKNLNEEIRKWLLEIRKLFDYRISLFVAPSNKITRKCLQAVVVNGLNFSGIVPLDFQRDFSARNIWNFIKRWLCRGIYRLPYPGVMRYSDHYEVNACALQSYDYLVKMYNFCEKRRMPMAVNVHYWSLRDNPNELELLRKFVMDYAIPRGAVPTKLSDLFPK